MKAICQKCGNEFVPPTAIATGSPDAITGTFAPTHEDAYKICPYCLVKKGAE